MTHLASCLHLTPHPTLSGGSQGGKAGFWSLLLGLSTLLSGCTTHHWAQVAETPLPPPPGEKIVHTGRLVIQVVSESDDTQCVAYEKYRPICFYDVRSSLENGLARSLWPVFPEVVISSTTRPNPSDYLLQIEVIMDALPPDDAGPGWSAGARSRFRLLREGKTLAEETLASRSQAQFPYGTPLSEGATDVMDATIIHIAQAISKVPEHRPHEPLLLPQVASRALDSEKIKNLQTTSNAMTGTTRAKSK